MTELVLGMSLPDRATYQMRAKKYLVGTPLSENILTMIAEYGADLIFIPTGRIHEYWRGNKRLGWHRLDDVRVPADIIPPGSCELDIAHLINRRASIDTRHGPYDLLSDNTWRARFKKPELSEWILYQRYAVFIEHHIIEFPRDSFLIVDEGDNFKVKCEGVLNAKKICATCTRPRIFSMHRAAAYVSTQLVLRKDAF